MNSDCKPIEYTLEIHAPGSADDTLLQLKSQRPFGAIGVGDVINLRHWDEKVESGYVLEVVRIQHIIFETGDSYCHQLMLYTKAVKDERSLFRSIA